MRRSVSESICRHMLATDAFQRATRIGLFYPLPWEPDVSPLWEARPGACAFPRAKAATREMAFHFLSSLSELSQGFAGIKEPPDEPGTLVSGWDARDLILVPGYAFDRSGGRIGSGFGFYDRFLAQVPSLKIGICYEAQIQNDRLAQDRTDVRMDGLCSELGFSLLKPR